MNLTEDVEFILQDFQEFMSAGWSLNRQKGEGGHPRLWVVTGAQGPCRRQEGPGALGRGCLPKAVSCSVRTCVIDKNKT